jgi:hypothetical protein
MSERAAISEKIEPKEKIFIKGVLKHGGAGGERQITLTGQGYILTEGEKYINLYVLQAQL